MMHRDLKSPNVLLSEEGVAKIADVGMVRAQVQDLVTAQPVMTPLWAAPEVSRLLQLHPSVLWPSAGMSWWCHWECRDSCGARWRVKVQGWQPAKAPQSL